MKRNATKAGNWQPSWIFGGHFDFSYLTA